MPATTSAGPVTRGVDPLRPLGTAMGNENSRARGVSPTPWGSGPGGHSAGGQDPSLISYTEKDRKSTSTIDSLPGAARAMKAGWRRSSSSSASSGSGFSSVAETTKLSLTHRDRSMTPFSASYSQASERVLVTASGEE